MPAPTNCRAPVQSRSVSTQCQLVSSIKFTINSVSSWLPLPSDNSHLVRVKCLFKKNGLLAVCGATDLGSTWAHNELSETEKLVDLSQYIFLFTSASTSSYNSHSKLKSMKILSDLRFDKAKFSCCCLHEATNLLQIVLWNGKGRPERPRPLLSLSTSCCLQGWQPKGLASLGQDV